MASQMSATIQFVKFEFYIRHLLKCANFISLNFVFDSAAYIRRLVDSSLAENEGRMHITNCKLQIDLYNNGNRPQLFSWIRQLLSHQKL